MISIKKIKNIAEKEDKKISMKALNEIEKILEKECEQIIKKASQQADFAGRKVIKDEDINKIRREKI